jgi:hypothetical protein
MLLHYRGKTKTINYILTFAWRQIETTEKPSVRMTRVVGEIQSKHIPKTNPQCYHYTNLVGVMPCSLGDGYLPEKLHSTTKTYSHMDLISNKQAVFNVFALTYCRIIVTRHKVQDSNWIWYWLLLFTNNYMIHKYLKLLTVQNYWVFGLFPSSGILETRKHSNSECYTHHRQNPLESTCSQFVISFLVSSLPTLLS